MLTSFNSFVFDPGLGQVRVGFLFSRYGYDFREIGTGPVRRAKTNSARKIPRRVGRTYSRWQPRVKANEAEKPPNMRDLGQKGRMAGSEWRVGGGPFATRHSLLAPS